MPSHVHRTGSRLDPERGSRASDAFASPYYLKVNLKALQRAARQARPASASARPALRLASDGRRCGREDQGVRDATDQECKEAEPGGVEGNGLGGGAVRSSWDGRLGWRRARALRAAQWAGHCTRERRAAQSRLARPEEALRRQCTEEARERRSVAQLRCRRRTTLTSLVPLTAPYYTCCGT